jgi:hypothetical protein
MYYRVPGNDQQTSQPWADVLSSLERENIAADNKCTLPEGLTSQSFMFPGSSDRIESYIIAALEQRNKFPKEGDEVMYYALPSCFFRLNFTSDINELPLVYLRWIGAPHRAHEG